MQSDLLALEGETLGLKKLPEAVRRLGGHAIVALGDGDPCGPWRLGLTRDPWTLRKNYSAAGGRPLIAGALVWFKADAFAQLAFAQVESAVKKLREDQRMPSPWFLMNAGDVQRMVEKAAAHWPLGTAVSHEAWIAKAEGR